MLILQVGHQRYTGIVTGNVTGMDFHAAIKNYTITVMVQGMEAGDKVTLPQLNGTLPTQTVGTAGENGTYIYTVPGLANYDDNSCFNKVELYCIKSFLYKSL